MNLDKNTFCSAPWFQIRNENSGQYRVCCLIDDSKSDFLGKKDYSWPNDSPEIFFNSDYVKYLRENLTGGKKIPDCHRCWQKEKAGKLSLRQMSNDIVTMNNGSNLDQTWVNSYIKNKNDFVGDHVLIADIKLTNTCNFSCIMCHPGNSSQIYTQWRKSQDKEIIKIQIDNMGGKDYLDSVRQMFMERSNYKLLEHVLQLKPIHLKLLGGEPLLDKIALEMLVSLNAEQKKQTTLTFVTNGSVDLCDIKSLLHGYKTVNFVLSLEGTDQVQDFVRRGSVWHEIENNVQKFIRCHTSKDLYIQHTIQAITLFHLPQLVEWTSKNNITINFDYLEEPEFLSLSALPTGLKEMIQLRLSDPQLKSIAHKLNETEWNPSHTKSLGQYIEWYDTSNIFLKLFPMWKDYL